MSADEVETFRQDNNNIVVTNFDSESKAPILKPVPKFEHAFHNYPDILATISCELLLWLISWICLPFLKLSLVPF